MNYILMHRKIPVAVIEIDEEITVITKIKDVLAPEHLPVGILTRDNIPDSRSLYKWWSGRSIPSTRQKIRGALENMNVSSRKLLLKSFSLSLSDQYWLNPFDNPLNWEGVNFFDNTFSEDVGDILFGKEIKDGIDFISPDNTTDG
jgi:hypothetical protein